MSDKLKPCMKYEHKKGEFIKDGHTMFIQDIIADLNYYRNKHLQKQPEKSLSAWEEAVGRVEDEQSYYAEQYPGNELLNEVFENVLKILTEIKTEIEG